MFPSTRRQFIAVSFYEPLPAEYYKAQFGVLKTFGMVGYNLYENGVSERSLISMGMWSKINSLDTPTFTNQEKSTNTVSVSDSEIFFAYNFKNLNGTTTNYQFTVRRSTMRFVATIFAPDTEKKTETFRSSDTGHCAEVSKTPQQ